MRVATEAAGAVRSIAQMVGRVVIAARTLSYIGAKVAEQGEVCVNSARTGAVLANCP
jgi:hypothetical protein